MSDPLFDTYVAYRLSTRDNADGPRRPRGPAPGCGCFAVALVGVAIVIVALTSHL